MKAYNASAEMADSAKTGLGNAIAKVKDMIDNGVDGQPTIRPILDLSDVEEKARILEIVRSEDKDGYSVYPTFKTIEQEGA